MLGPEHHLEPDAAEVAAKVIDGEAILINLGTGAYYSMAGVGAAVWQEIENGRSAAQIVEAVASTYDVPWQQIHDDIESLVARLVEERLVCVSANGASTAPGGSGESAAVYPDSPYSAPELVKYTDMADLLALDPPMPGLADNPWVEPDGTR